ncbi:MAG: nuclear transport factor 2 family protein [Solirubrobacterales bacterium]
MEEARERDLETLRGLYSEWARGDFDNSDYFTDDVVWDPGSDILEIGEFTGKEAMSANWRGFLQAFSQGFRIEAEEIIPGSEGRYVVMQLFEGIGKASGVETKGRTALAITMRDGKIAEMHGFLDREAALRAAGIDTDAGR